MHLIWMVYKGRLLTGAIAEGDFTVATSWVRLLVLNFTSCDFSGPGWILLVMSGVKKSST